MKFGDCKEHRGTFHEYLGMELENSMPGKVKITMIPYLEETLDEFPEEITATCTTPAAEYLFKVREDAPKAARGTVHAVPPICCKTCVRAGESSKGPGDGSIILNHTSAVV